jgi:hypothetical protein
VGEPHRNLSNLYSRKADHTMTDLTDLALGWRAGRSGHGKQPL